MGFVGKRGKSLTHINIVSSDLINIHQSKKKVNFMIKKTNANKFGVVEYAISTEEEVTHLPHLVGQGSTCIVVATGNVYMFNEENSSWHSLVDSSIVVKPDGAYNKPEITSLTMTPINPAWGEAVTFNYEATYDNSSKAEEKWYNKCNNYPVGKNKVGVQVKDQRGKWSDIKYIEFRIAEPKKPVISNFRIEPAEPVVDQTISYLYDVEFENERITKRDEWFSSNKKTQYDLAGKQSIQLKVKDNRNLWSEAATLTFTVGKKTVNKEESESLTKTTNQTYTIPQGWTFSSVGGVGTHQNGQVVFNAVGQCVVKVTKPYEEENQKGIITKTVTITVNKQQIIKEEEQTATVKANQKYIIPVGYNFASVDGVGSRVLQTNEIIFSGSGVSTVKAKKVEESDLATTTTTLTTTITVEETVAFDGYLTIASEDWVTIYAEGSGDCTFNLETASKVSMAFFGNSSTEGLYKKQYSNIQLNGQPLDLTNVIPSVDSDKIESHSYLDGVLKIATKYTGVWAPVFYVIDLEQGENTITFDCVDWD